jgi:outer membrane receptor protein involved in Fe transport
MNISFQGPLPAVVIHFGRRTACLVFTLLVSALSIWAQAETGQITGTVSDQTGAAVVGASIGVTNVDTGTTRVTLSNADGVYAVTNLIPGEFEVTVTAPGFNAFKNKVNVTVGAKVGLDVKLQIGKSTTVVEVTETAAAVQVNTETQTITQTLSTAAMNELPTVSRNPYALVVTSGNVSEDDPSGRGVGVAMNGLRSAGTNVLLDGVANNDEFVASVGQMVPVDSVQEMGITTSNFTAEMGRASAGIVNVTTKSGTNAFHGTVYEFNRVSALASNQFLNNAEGLPKSIFTRNNFGFSIGGPVKKNKLFFFNNTEWTRVRSVANTVAWVIDPAYIAASAPAAQQVYSQYGKLVPGAVTLGTYSRNQLIAQGLDPCGGSASGGGCQSYNPNSPMLDQVSYNSASDAGGGLPQNTYDTVSRVDYNFSDKTQAYVRYALYSEMDLPGSVVNSPYQGFNTGQTIFNNSLLLAVTHAFSERFVSQTKLDFNRFNNDQPLSSTGVVPGYFLGSADVATALGNYNVAMPGYGPYAPGNAIPFGGPQNFGQLYEDLSFVTGKHEIRWGGTFTYIRDNRTFGAYEESDNILGPNIGQGLDNLAAGNEYEFEGAIYPQGKYPCVNGVQTTACTINLPVTPPNFSRSNRYEESALYVQDSWKIRPRLTLNLGVRWEYFGVQHNVNSELDSNFYLPAMIGPQNPAFPAAVAAGTVLPAPQSPIGTLWAASPLNFAPRVGIAWDVFGDGKTSLRGGYAIGYERNFGNVTYNVLFNPPNYAVVDAIQGTQGFQTVPLSTTNYGIMSGSSGSIALPPSELRWVQPNIPQSYAHLISASIEHEFRKTMHLEVDYSGSIGENQYDISYTNFPGTGNYYLGIPCNPALTLSGAPGGCQATLNDQYAGINLRGAGGHSTYNSMNVRYDIQDIHHTGLTMRANYTYSHSIDDLSDTFSTSGNQFNLGYTDFQNPSVDKGSSEFDNRHRVAIMAIWDMPFAKNTHGVAKYVFSGWELAPVFTARTGAPFSIYDLSNDNYLYTRVVLDQTAPAQTRAASGIDTYTLYNFANIATGAYVNPKCGCSDFGPFPANMTGRDAFPTPGTWNLDLGMYKNVKFAESKYLQLRLEAYNAFNHANFAVNTGSAYIFDGAGSTITGGYTGNRNVQLGVKFVF